MRSKFLLCAAIAAAASSSLVTVAHAAPKKKVDAQADGAKAKPTELHADDKSMKRQSQWEDKVMGPDSTRKDLEKIARARAINEKAAAERERQAALDPAPKAPKVDKVDKVDRKAEKAEVSLLTTPAEKSDAKAHEISPELSTAAAMKAPAPVKPADDKFIDKLLRSEDGPSKKRASANDRELENLLAGAKEQKASGGRNKRGDSVDDLLKTADKGPAMPAPRAQSGGLPEWAKTPEIAPSAAPPPPSPLAARPVPAAKKNDGVIQVVQGAAGNGPAVIAPSRGAPLASARPTAPIATTRGGRKTVAAKSAAPVAWSDPFAEKKPVAEVTSKKAAASHPSVAPESNWNDPFAEPSGETRKNARRSSPAAAPSAPASAPKRNSDKGEPGARPAGWKDPFTKAPTEPTRAPVAMRELGKSESSKWEIATHRTSTVAAASRASHLAASDAHAAGGWSVLKKRAR